MGITTSLILIAAGAIMRFAVTAQATGFSVHTVGVILMIVGAVGFVISLIFWSSWGGYSGVGGSSRLPAIGLAPVRVSGSPQAWHTSSDTSG
jgi:hypothetical protein